MTLGDVIMWTVFTIGAYPVVRLLWKSYGRKAVKPSQEAPPVVMSRSEPKPAPIAPSDLRQTAPTDQTDAPPAPVVKSATLDTCRDMRAHGYTREAARAHLRALGWALDNNTWAQAKPEPPDDDLTVTPFAGRVTRRSFYESEPELEYQEPPQ